MVTSVRLSLWDNYGFTVPKSQIVSWIANSRKNGIMREGAVLRHGQRYWVDPQRLDIWMHNHSEGTPLKRDTRARDEDKDTRAGDDQKQQAKGDGQKQQTKRKTLHTGNPSPGNPSLEDDQVMEIRQQAAKTPEADRLRLYGSLAAKFGRHEKVIEQCAEGKTYKRLPLTQTYQATETTAS